MRLKVLFYRIDGNDAASFSIFDRHVGVDQVKKPDGDCATILAGSPS